MEWFIAEMLPTPMCPRHPKTTKPALSPELLVDMNVYHAAFEEKSTMGTLLPEDSIFGGRATKPKTPQV